jgi:CubicO group peptidase (beta-lactamase class C family)
MGSRSVEGSCSPQYEALRAVFTEHVLRGDESGAAIAVDVAGTLVVDLWGGSRDVAGARPWQRDTIVNLWSTTKTITALAVLILVDRGLLDPEERVAHY